MKVIVYLLAVFLALVGLVFIFAAGEGNALVRIVIGAVCIGAAGALVALVKLKPIQETHVHHSKLDLSGDVSVEQFTCNQCGATLSDSSVNVSAGAVFVHCEHCGTQYQIEEAPKW